MYTLTVAEEQITAIVIQEMNSVIDSLEIDLQNRIDGHGFAIFSHDVNEDVEIIRKHIDAAKLIKSYYGG